MFEIVDEKRDGAVIKVIGVGGCGGNAVEHMINKGVAGVEFIAANTDAQVLDRNPAPKRIPLGAELTQGLGAGAKPEVGRDAAMESKMALQESIRGADMLFITAGMGGGTGTGAAPVVAQLAKEMGILVVAVVTKPFRFEMQKRERAAQAGVDELQKHVDSLIVVPNEKLIQVLGRNVSLPAAFAASNDVLHGAVAGISEIINKRGLVNRDFADVRTIMSELGMAMMGTATASGEERGKAAAMAAIKSPLLEDVDLQGARGVLLNITTSSNVELGELYDVTDTVAEFVSADATVLWGHVIDDEMGDEMRVTMVATGLGAKRKMQAVQGGAAAAPRLEIPTLRTGTDNLGVATEAAPVTAGIEVSYDEPTFVRNPGRNTARSLEIPTFLRKQAD
ncbi:MAG TPA: cell division protein FtsZ [Casimicrobium huifangae]|jgi:cell division protein FtsZ|uniref:cell division protein FtsZ n=1 Tax=Casimicrobium huifangae TaxID=2591109 RepID=UPI0012EB3E8F|nr:cell division protein FtsZ [Casimicrobium huifangae]HOB00661.1 cell division protein FtsZ [Casimicrobium huifangae]HQD65811.1 cell division protein FtsZ [Casimicrobium huifangae]